MFSMFRTASSHYNQARLWQLRGLRQLLLGILLLGFAIGPWIRGLGRSVEFVFLPVMLLIILANLILPTRIDAYYTRLLAPLKMTPPVSPTGSLSGRGCFFLLLGLVPLIIGLMWLTRLRLQIDILLLLFAIVLGSVAVLRWNDHKIDLILALFVLVVSLLPSLGLATADQYYSNHTPVGILRRAVVGLVLLVSGLYDHYLFIGNVRKLAASHPSGGPHK
jgi:hypothetical protein